MEERKCIEFMGPISLSLDCRIVLFSGWPWNKDYRPFPLRLSLASKGWCWRQTFKALLFFCSQARTWLSCHENKRFLPSVRDKIVRREHNNCVHFTFTLRNMSFTLSISPSHWGTVKILLRFETRATHCQLSFVDDIMRHTHRHHLSHPKNECCHCSLTRYSISEWPKSMRSSNLNLAAQFQFVFMQHHSCRSHERMSRVSSLFGQLRGIKSLFSLSPFTWFTCSFRVRRTRKYAKEQNER